MTVDAFYLRHRLQASGSWMARSGRPPSRRRTHRAPGDSPDLSAEEKRNILVERVARELFDNLLFTDSDTPLVQEVRQNLAEDLGEEVIFRYLPGSSDVQVFRVRSDGETEALPQSRQAQVMERAWTITLARVDETML